MLQLALYHPQIPQNAGTLLRLCSCVGIHVDLIRPFGFVFDDRRLTRAAMDYINTADYEIHDSFEKFCEKYPSRRLIAMDSNDVDIAYNNFTYEKDDILIVGSEHYGFMKDDFEKMSGFVKIPMLPNRRSINMAISAAIILSEAMSQLRQFPKLKQY